jgi:hypothetical protein
LDSARPQEVSTQTLTQDIHTSAIAEPNGPSELAEGRLKGYSFHRLSTGVGTALNQYWQSKWRPEKDEGNALGVGSREDENTSGVLDMNCSLQL